MSTERESPHTNASGPGDEAFERRASELLVDSSEHLDGRVRSRLTQARHAALAELQQRQRSSFRVPGFWLPAGAVAAATVLALAVWLRAPSPEAPRLAAVGEVTAVEDIAILAAAEEPELYAEDAEFYEWAGAAADGTLDLRGG